MLSFLFLVIVVVVSFLKNRNSGINTVLILTLYFILAFEHSDQDYMSYLTAYNEVGEGRNLLLGYEPAFLWFCELGNEYHLTFDQARCIVCIFEIFAIVATIKSVTPSIGLVLSLFCVYPCLQNAELFRWMVAMSIIIFALRFIIRAQSRKDYALYTLLVIVASTMHTSCLFFMLFLLTALNSKKFIAYFAGCSILFSLITTQISLFYRILGFLGVSEFLVDKFSEMNGLNAFGMVSMILKDLLIFYIGYISIERAKHVLFNCDNNNYFRVNTQKISTVCNDMGFLLCSKLYYFNVLSLIIFAVGFHFPHAQRLLDVLLFINLLAVAYLNDISPWKIGIRKTVISTTVLFFCHLLSGSQNLDIFMSHFREGFLVNLFGCIFNN